MSPTKRNHWDGALWNGVTETTPIRPTWVEWSDSLLPWDYVSQNDWLNNLEIPGSIPIVPLAGSGTNFKSRLDLTASGQTGNFIVQLEAGIYEFPGFYALNAGEYTAYWDTSGKLCGMVGRGADQTFVQVAPNSMSAACLTYLEGLAYGGPTVSQVSALRIDHRNTNHATSGATPHGVYMGGITFRAPDQQSIYLHSSFPVTYFEPQPAPFTGFRPYTGDRNITRISHCRFQAFGHAVSSMPPFEAAQVGTQRSLDFKMWNCEFDGRLSSDFNINRPRRGTVWQLNDEGQHRTYNTWGHHSNISRWALNDDNSNARGITEFNQCKLEFITDTKNAGDPDLNNGGSLGGWTHASCMGYESFAGTAIVKDSVLCMDNPYLDTSQKPMHLQFTTPLGAVRTGGSFTMTGTICRSSGQPTLNGWVLMRLDNATQWYTEGPANRIFIHHPTTGARLTYLEYTGTWPPSPAQLASWADSGITKDTHYIAQTI